MLLILSFLPLFVGAVRGFSHINVSLMTTILSGGACEEQGGQCVDWRYYVCHAGVESGICPGDSNIRYIDTWSWSDC